ncbi:hypothetical protein MSG28_007655 [Choristoneura fumiferana]|uniref:Uncharacterized protein n=1 Tax=Choristoneura fumiferana TaxID=7141 RepID=A0ACC0JYQ2_CHOFU|nr:hypothetical protein MSG28_007655 [Choristoneura fumiferana]
MFTKVLAAAAIVTVALCQDHHHSHSYSTVIQHEAPKKVEYHVPSHTTYEFPSHQESLSNQVTNSKKYTLPTAEEVEHLPPPVVRTFIPSEPAPVHQNQEPPVPVQKYFTPVNFQAKPIQPPLVQYQPLPVFQQSAPVQHQPAPIVHQSFSIQQQPIVTYESAPVYHQAAPIHHETPVHHEVQQSHHQEEHHEHGYYYAHPKYEFEYKVQDPHTGDNKYQHESRDGDVVKGVYSLHEADGSALILAIAVGTTYCQEHHYAHKTLVRPEQPQEYTHHASEHASHQEPAPIYEIQYQTAPESHEQAISSQSVQHEPAEHEIKHAAPTYQYVQAQQEQHEPVHFHHGVSLQSLHKHAAATRFAPQKYQSHHEPSHYESHYSQEALNHHHAPQQHQAHHQAHSEESHEEPIDYYAHPKYQYEYKVEDPHTGDNKYQHEVRDGDVVKGVYSLLEADGSIRTINKMLFLRFNAVVKHSAPGQHVHIEQRHKN